VQDWSFARSFESFFEDMQQRVSTITNDSSGVPQFSIWSPDGKEIFYSLGLGGGRTDLMSIPVQTGPSFSFGRAASMPIKNFWHNGAPGAPRRL